MKNQERLKRITEALLKEKKDAAHHEEEIMNKIRNNEKKKELEMKIDANMMLIQKTFEQWLKLNPPKGKRNKGGKGKKK
jgi:hypothetical protein